ncbi:MAG: Nif3-like dinuclear metal center hexameric protein [Lachnospiraceae bacterium]
MNYNQMKEKLLGMFDSDKLHKTPHEWGFYNEIDRVIRRLGYATNISVDIIKNAAQENVDFLLTHHDSWGFIYGLKEACNTALEESGISHAFFHAPLDGAEFGTSASLAKALGLMNCRMVMPYAEIYHCGIIGEIPATDFAAFKELVSGILQAPVRTYQNNDRMVRKVAVAAGAGNMTSEMKQAADAGCDTYITGEYVLYSQQYAQLTGMNLIVGTHTNTEILGVESMAGLLAGDTDIELVRIEEPDY